MITLHPNTCVGKIPLLLFSLLAVITTACQKTDTGIAGPALKEQKTSLATSIINVSTSAALNTALSNATDGDIIVLADGSYSGFSVTKNNITIQAANKGKAIISSGIIRYQQISGVTIQGLKITTSGASKTVDGESFKLAVWFEASDDCRLAGCTIVLNGHSKTTDWIMLSGNSNNNRIDHNEFGANNIEGHYIFVRGNRTGISVPSDRTDWANGNGPNNPNVARNTTIDYNYFHDQTTAASAAITMGGIGLAGDYQHTNTIFEKNLLVNCDGDAEIIENKSSNNIIRNNTIRTSIGMISLRSGNNCTVSGNLMLQEGKTGTGGIKIYEKNHTVTGNYIDNPQDYGFVLGAGDSYTNPSFGHAQVFNANVSNNIWINLNTRGAIIGHGGDGTVSPVGCTFANNALRGSVSPLINLSHPGNTVFTNNTTSGSNPGMPSTPLTTANTGPASYSY